ncbi:hydrogenase 4 subunit D [Pasteurellaceae bacterium LIM206]|nr:hydrogenase 4 subunit D [Pasteurellaceae bacterium LIM206]
MEHLALITIVLPFVGAFLVGLDKNAARFPKTATLFAALATLGTLLLAQQWYASGQSSVSYDVVKFGNTVIFGITLDAVSTLIGFAVVALGFLIILYSNGYLTEKNREHSHPPLPRFYAFLLVFVGAMAGLVLSSTLVGQLLFFEITGACSWALISYYQTPKAQAAAMKALIITHVGSLGLYIAAAYLFSQTGTFSVTALEQTDPTTKTIVLFGVMFAAWGKSAQLPLQIWLPNAMEAPTPVSAYLHAASMVKVGVYIFARAVMSAGDIPHIVGEVGLVMAMITLIYGFLMYLPQTDLKRLLAYSTITQLSYIFIGLSLFALGSKLAFVAAIAYIFNHAFAKSLFFLVAGSLAYATGTRLMPRLRGIMRTMPLVGAGFGVAALAIAGVPPFNGFFSKFPLFAAGFALGREQMWITVLMVIALIESTATFVWLLYKFGQCVPGKPSEEVARAQPLPFSMSVVLIILMVMSVCSGFIAAYWLDTPWLG